MMKNFEEQLNEVSRKMKEFVESDQMKQLQRYCEIISNLQKLGKDYNWVVVSTDINTNIANEDEAEINKYFLSLIENNIDLYQSIKNEIFGCSYMIDKHKLMEQIFDAIDHRNYWIACIGLSTVLEFLLATESDFNSIKMQVLLKKFMDNVGYIGINEYEVGFLFSLDGFLENYSISTNGFGRDKEPKYINRHWIAHGRMYRELSKIDTYQILLAIYALIRIMNMERRIKAQEED